MTGIKEAVGGPGKPTASMPAMKAPEIVRAVVSRAASSSATTAVATSVGDSSSTTVPGCTATTARSTTSNATAIAVARVGRGSEDPSDMWAGYCLPRAGTSPDLAAADVHVHSWGGFVPESGGHPSHILRRLHKFTGQSCAKRTDDRLPSHLGAALRPLCAR